MQKDEIEQLLHREELQLASITKRGSAFFLDEFLLSLLLVISLWDAFGSATNTLELIALSQQFTLEYIILKIIYQTFFVMMYGATLGKMMMRIRIVELPTLNKPSFFASLNRAIVRIFSEMLFYLGFVWGMMDPLRRTWHDLSAKTLVVES
ncbi:FIG00387922: hypothetical protein [hydrothermal vent metagenome]|uniref:RDD domain-containing protein n=1 Tax=hydrothermal vent metagenome TaxID=652676 RepID=A0A1W1BWK2_9ZZZZ